jgi:eukaryotic-like serine/threonine-protein kinase
MNLLGVDGSSPPDDRSNLLGKVLDGRYHVLTRIGGGGTGIVFEAICLRTGDNVAIKTLRPSLNHHLDLATRLRRELEVSRRVLHPGLVRFSHDGTLPDGSPYLVMPLLRGESLSQLLLRQRGLSSAAVLMLASRVASILHSSHAAGYVHRDIKPEHIHFSKNEQGDLRVHLLDFGVCSSAYADPEEKRRESGRVFGTPRYVSPEQASGEVKIDGRADLFGLGVVMFEALTGSVPFSAPSVAKLLLRIVREDAPRVSALISVDARVDSLVAALLVRDPLQRMPSARSLSRALLPFSAERAGAERELLARLVEARTADGTCTTVECASVVGRKVRVA